MNNTGRYLKTFLVLSVLLNFALGYKYIKTKFTYHPDYSYNRKELFEHLPADSSSIVFAGNSLTAQFELAELLNKANLRNRGINGDRTDGLLGRLPNIIKAQPQKIFIEIGINDLCQGVTKEQLLDNYSKILTRLQQESKGSKLYVQSLLPVNSTGPAIINSIFPVKNETIAEVNKALQSYCADHNITYVNLYDKFTLQGEMNPEYCIADGLHISGKGYLLWATLLKQYVEE